MEGPNVMVGDTFSSGRSAWRGEYTSGARRRVVRASARRSTEGRSSGPPAEPPFAGAAGDSRRLRAEVRARTREIGESVEAALRALGGVEIIDPAREQSQVVVYAASSPSELIALLGPDFTPHPRAALLASIEPRVAALLGFLGYLRPECTAERHCYCLQAAADGDPCAPEPFDREFHRGREHGALTVECKRVLNLLARGRTHEQIQRELPIGASTLKRRVQHLRKALRLASPENLALAAARRMGLG
jgi:DNA-binding CsgD family transcriptional regulator